MDTSDHGPLVFAITPLKYLLNAPVRIIVCISSVVTLFEHATRLACVTEEMINSVL
jgi:hypothetical protein